MMAPEEIMILQWIQQYEVISTEQALRLLHHKGRNTAQKIVRGLQKQHYISYVQKGVYIGIYPCSVPDPKTIDALWVLLQFGDQVKQNEHHVASYPSQIFFLKEGVGYEIMVLHQGEEYLTKLLQPVPDMKYILVVPNEEMIPAIELPDAPCIFAVIQWNGGNAPEVSFYSKEM